MNSGRDMLMHDFEIWYLASHWQSEVRSIAGNLLCHRRQLFSTCWSYFSFSTFPGQAMSLDTCMHILC